MVFFNHAETSVMVHFWEDVISAACMKSVVIPLGGFFINDDSESKCDNGCRIVVKLVVEVFPS